MSVLRTQLRGVARRPSRLLLTGLAVLVVSFVVYATVLAQQITERTVLNSLSGTPEAADVVVHDGMITSAELAAVQKIPGVAETVGRVDNGAQIGGEYLSLLSDPGTGPLSQVKVAQGRYPSKPGEVAVTPRTVERMGLQVGKTVTAQIRYDEDGKPLESSKLTVVGVVDVRDDFGFQAYGPTESIMKLGGYDWLSRIELRLGPGTDASAVMDRINAVITASTKIKADDRPQVQDGSTVRHEEAEAAASEINSIFAVIAMFIAIAVVAAGLVATSTFRIVFAQRMRQLALLRAVGAGRGPITRALAAEGALTGLVTGVAGVLIALGVGHLFPVVAGWFGKSVFAPGFPVLAALLTVLLAVFLTTVAVLAPAASASRVSPLEALRGAGTTGARRDIGKLRWATGLLFLLGAAMTAGYIVTNLPGRDTKDYDPQPMLLALVASGAFAFFALVALGPVLVRPVLALIGWPLRRSSPVGRLAAGGVGSAPRRAAAVSVVVALGVTLIAGTLVGGASLRVLADREIAASAPADYELLGIDETPVPAALAEQLKQREELTDVTPYRRVTVNLDAYEGVSATDLAMTSLPELKKVGVAAGSLDDLGPGKVALSDFGAEASGKTVGDQIQLKAGKRTVKLTVVAQFAEDGPLHTSAVLVPDDLTKLGVPAATFSGVLANAKEPGESARTKGNRAIQDTQVAAGGKWRIDVLADQRDQLNNSVNLLLLIAIGLVGLTVIIAVVGVGTTTALSVVERVRESGVLRAVGLSRAGLRTMLTTESALYGAIGAAVGLALGIPYAWLAVKALGLNAPIALPYGQLAIVFLVLIALTALAGVLPARRAAKVSPVAALGTE